MSTDNLSGDAAAPVAEVAPASDASLPEAPSAGSSPLPDTTTAPEAPAPDAPAPEPAPEGDAPAADAGSLVEAAPEPAPDAAKPVGEAPAEVAAEPITYGAFTFPEGLTVDDAELTLFTEVLGKHAATQEFGQELIDLHTAQLQRYADTLQQQQIDTFARTREGWRTEFEASAGNRRDTLLTDAKSAITSAVPDEADRKALWDVLSFTGAGDNPRVINAFAALGAKLRERGAPPPSLPTNAARTGRPEDRRYGAASQR